MAADWPAGFDRVILEEVDSTNAEAMRRDAVLRAPTWIMARRQTAGRGRRGRGWYSPSGNLSATLTFRPERPARQVALHSFVAALAVHDALALLTGRGALLSCKWPNDILLAGRKVAGILLESRGEGVEVTRLAVGIGVNLAEAPLPAALDSPATPPISVQATLGLRIEPEEFLRHLAQAYAERWRSFEQQGFEPIRRAWLARAARLGQEITARTGRESIRGVFETVDGNGALVITTPEGRRVLPAAEVFY